MDMRVEKSDNALILFQDRFETALRKHLTEFFNQKINTPNFGYGKVDEVAISSQLTWTAITDDDQAFDAFTNPDQNQHSVARRYEVHADQQSEITLNLTSKVSSSVISDPIVTLMMIESFQGGNYWDLYQIFMSDSILKQIQDVKISVSADGFVPNANQGISSPLSIQYTSQTPTKWTLTMIIGVSLASFFGLVLIAMWAYVCLFIKGSFLFKRPNEKELKDGKADSDTEANSSEQSYDFGFGPGEEEAWMDAWAKSITSIPVREPKKRSKSKKKTQTRRPAQKYQSSLEQIEESDDENSCASSTSWASSSDENYGDRLVYDDDDDEEFDLEAMAGDEELGSACSAIVLYKHPTNEIVVYERRDGAALFTSEEESPHQQEYYGTSC